METCPPLSSRHSGQQWWHISWPLECHHRTQGSRGGWVAWRGDAGQAMIVDSISQAGRFWGLYSRSSQAMDTCLHAEPHDLLLSCQHSSEQVILFHMYKLDALVFVEHFRKLNVKRYKDMKYVIFMGSYVIYSPLYWQMYPWLLLLSSLAHQPASLSWIL